MDPRSTSLILEVDLELKKLLSDVAEKKAKRLLKTNIQDQSEEFGLEWKKK